VRLRSRNDKDFAARYPVIVSALDRIPNDTILDGELVAFDASGRPSFNMLHNYGSSAVPIYFNAFDLPLLAGGISRHSPSMSAASCFRPNCYRN
jgi:ATP-dependent DNA ligase